MEIQLADETLDIRDVAKSIVMSMPDNIGPATATSACGMVATAIWRDTVPPQKHAAILAGFMATMAACLEIDIEDVMAELPKALDHMPHVKAAMKRH